MGSIHDHVEKKVRSHKRGALVFPSDFKYLGSTNAVKMALSRLAKEGVVKRIAQGVYLYPKIDAELGTLTPSLEAVAHAVAQRDRATLLPSGEQALQMLGLSTQVPMKVTYLTNGSPRILKMGRRTISLKRASPKRLAMKGKVSGLVVQALQALGKGNVTVEVKAIVADALKREQPKNIMHDILLAPEWIAILMREVTQIANI